MRTIEKRKLYTAIGCLEFKTNSKNQTHPIILLSGNEYMADLQEMLIWSCLNWRIARLNEIRMLYEKAATKAGLSTGRTFESCIERLVLRGLLACGIGDTEYDALYDMLAPLYPIPTQRSLPARAAAFLKLTLCGGIPLSAAGKLFKKDRRTEDEKHVMSLAKQAMLSTAEIIKCVEYDIHYLPNEESILDSLYCDQYTTSDNLPFTARCSPSCRQVTLAVASLYLRRQFTFEQI